MNRDYVIGIPAVQAGMVLATLTGSMVQSMVSDVATMEYSPLTATTLGLATITWVVE